MNTHQVPRVTNHCKQKLPPAGLEPATLALLAPCSNHLSYGGLCRSARTLHSTQSSTPSLSNLPPHPPSPVHHSPPPTLNFPSPYPLYHSFHPTNFPLSVTSHSPSLPYPPPSTPFPTPPPNSHSKISTHTFLPSNLPIFHLHALTTSITPHTFPTPLTFANKSTTPTKSTHFLPPNTGVHDILPKSHKRSHTSAHPINPVSLSIPHTFHNQNFKMSLHDIPHSIL